MLQKWAKTATSSLVGPSSVRGIENKLNILLTGIGRTCFTGGLAQHQSILQCIIVDTKGFFAHALFSESNHGMGQTNILPTNVRKQPSAFLIDASNASSEVPIRFSAKDIPKEGWHNAEETARTFYSEYEWSRFNDFTRARILTTAIEFQYKDLENDALLNMSTPNPWAIINDAGLEEWPAPTIGKQFTKEQQDAFRDVMLQQARINRLAQRQWGDKFYHGKMKLRRQCSRCIEARKECERDNVFLVCAECRTHRSRPRCENMGHFYVDFVSRVLNINLADSRALYDLVDGLVEESPDKHLEGEKAESMVPRKHRGRIPGKWSAKKMNFPTPHASPSPRRRHNKNRRVNVTQGGLRGAGGHSVTVKLGRRSVGLCGAPPSGHSSDSEGRTTRSPFTSFSDVELVDNQTLPSTFSGASIVANRKPSSRPTSRAKPQTSTSNQIDILSPPPDAQLDVLARRAVAPFTDARMPSRYGNQISGNAVVSQPYPNSYRQSIMNADGRMLHAPNHATTSYDIPSHMECPINGGMNVQAAFTQERTARDQLPNSQNRQARNAHPDIGQLQMGNEALQRANNRLQQRYTALHTLSGNLLQEVSDAQSMLEISVPLINDALRSSTEVPKPLCSLIEQQQRLRTAALTYRKGIWELDEAFLL